MRDLIHHDSNHAHQREVTLLFADLRGFTELAASLEMVPLVCELLAHVMDCLTDAVADHEGTVVDYYGDGMVAMWNAPADQPEHAELACAASLQMLKTLPAVTADWIGVTQIALRLGIGVHTGNVHVGNAGSTRQKKYGPRGPNVHVAKRVEAATKELCVPFLTTQPTVERLSGRYMANRVCRARMPGLPQPMDLFAVCASSDHSHASTAWKKYDTALRQFEQDQFDEAAHTLTTIDATIAEVPTRFLAERVQSELGRHRRRRSSDKPVSCPDGVISISAK